MSSKPYPFEFSQPRRKWSPLKPPARPATGDSPRTQPLPPLEFRIVIECRDERHQTDLLSRFDAEGLSARPLIS